MTIGVPNSLEHVYKYYCGATMNKEPRDVFVKGTVQSIREQYQVCIYQVWYCNFKVFRYTVNIPYTNSGRLM